VEYEFGFALRNSKLFGVPGVQKSTKFVVNNKYSHAHCVENKSKQVIMLKLENL